MNDTYRTQMCKFFLEKKRCRAKNCQYAHGQDQLRKKGDPMPVSTKKSGKEKKPRTTRRPQKQSKYVPKEAEEDESSAEEGADNQDEEQK